MPAKIQLLTAAPAGTTGLTTKVGTGMPPITFRTQGGYGLAGGGAVGSKGVNIEFSVDGGTTWARVMGLIGGPNFTEVANAETVDLPDGTSVDVPFYAGGHVRALTGAGMTGLATVYMEFPR